MSQLTLRLVAYITMIIDHAGICFLHENGNTWYYLLARGIGRISFPIFCFLIAEGYLHSHDIKKYAVRLGILAVVSEFPFDYMLQSFDTARVLGDKMYPMYHQNVVFTLLISLLMLTALDMLRLKAGPVGPVYNIGGALIITIAAASTTLIHSDHEIIGVVFAALFYFFRYRSKAVLSAVFIILTICAYIEPGSYFWINYVSVLALIPIILYMLREERTAEEKKPAEAVHTGIQSVLRPADISKVKKTALQRNLKYGFYLVYPLHMLIFGLLR